MWRSRAIGLCACLLSSACGGGPPSSPTGPTTTGRSPPPARPEPPLTAVDAPLAAPSISSCQAHAKSPRRLRTAHIAPLLLEHVRCAASRLLAELGRPETALPHARGAAVPSAAHLSRCPLGRDRCGRPMCGGVRTDRIIGDRRSAGPVSPPRVAGARLRREAGLQSRSVPVPTVVDS